MRPFYLRILPGLLLVLVACLPAAARAEAMPYGQGLLWKIERSDGKTSCLFGTMHSADPRIVALPDPVASCFDGANSFVMEVVPDDALQRRVVRMMQFQDGRRLDDVIGADLFSRTADIGDLYHIPAQVLRQLKPWAVAVMLSFTPDETMRRADGELALDERLEREARAAGKSIHDLETPEEQLRPFDSLSLEQQREMLEATVTYHSELEIAYERMKRDYLARNTEAIFALLQESSVGADDEIMRWFEDEMITRRNHRMAERLRPHLAEGGAFIAVGAAHLPGDEGLLRLLERQGHTVTRLY